MDNATRKCTETGEWYISKELDKYWTNYTQCYGSDRATVFMELPQDLSKLNGSMLQVRVKQMLADNTRVMITISV